MPFGHDISYDRMVEFQLWSMSCGSCCGVELAVISLVFGLILCDSGYSLRSAAFQVGKTGSDAFEPGLSGKPDMTISKVFCGQVRIYVW